MPGVYGIPPPALQRGRRGVDEKDLQPPTPTHSARRRGSVLLYVVLTMPVLIGFASFAVDFGRIELAKLQLQRAADAGARYAVTGLRTGRDESLARAKTAAAENGADGSPIAPADVAVEYGRYDYGAKTFLALASDDPAADAVRVTVSRAMQMTLRDAIGAGGSITVGRSSVAFLPGALFVVGESTAMPTKDVMVRDTLRAMGYSVRTLSARNTKAADAAGRAVVVISESMSSGDLNTKLRDVAVPVVCYESYLFDDMKMTGSAGTEWGHSNPQTQINWIQPSHYDGYSGPLTVFDATTEMNFGKPSPSALVFATSVENSSKALFFTYEKGDQMVGMAAPHRRALLWIGDASHLTPTGWSIFRSAVDWAANGRRAIQTVR